jgi:hypothetical protein
LTGLPLGLSHSLQQNLDKNRYQQDVRDDRPVEVEGDLTEEDEGEPEEDVGAGVKKVGKDEDSRKDEAESADQWVRPGEPLPQAGTQQSAQGHPQHTGYHSHGAKDKRNTENSITVIRYCSNNVVIPPY